MDFINPGNIIWAAIMAASGYGVFQRRGYPPLVGAAIGLLAGLFLVFWSVFLVGLLDWGIGRNKTDEQAPTADQPSTWGGANQPQSGQTEYQSPLPDDGYAPAPSKRDDGYAPEYNRDDGYAPAPSKRDDGYASASTRDDGYAPAPSKRDDGYAPASTDANDVQRRLAELESYRQQGIITQKEYNEMRRAAQSGKGS